MVVGGGRTRLWDSRRKGKREMERDVGGRAEEERAREIQRRALRVVWGLYSGRYGRCADLRQAMTDSGGKGQV